MTYCPVLFPIDHFRGHLRATAIDRKKSGSTRMLYDSPELRLVHHKKERKSRRYSGKRVHIDGGKWSNLVGDIV